MAQDISNLKEARNLLTEIQVKISNIEKGYEKANIAQKKGLQDYGAQLEAIVSSEKISTKEMVKRASLIKRLTDGETSLADVALERAKIIKKMKDGRVKEGGAAQKGYQTDLKTLDAAEKRLKTQQVVNASIGAADKLPGGLASKANELKDSFKDSGLYDTDITTIKMYKGVKPLWKHLGFENDDSDIPNQNTYWKNIIPNDFDYSNLSGIETNEVTVDDDIGVSKGSKIPRQSYTEIIINSESEQVWDDNYYYPVLPTLNKFGVFEEDVNVETSFGNNSIASITNLDEVDDNLILNIDFDQTTTDDLIDKTNLNHINYTQDFEVSLDDNLRIKTDTLIIPDGIEKDNSQQAF